MNSVDRLGREESLFMRSERATGMQILKRLAFKRSWNKLPLGPPFCSPIRVDWPSMLHSLSQPLSWAYSYLLIDVALAMVPFLCCTTTSPTIYTGPFPSIHQCDIISPIFKQIYFSLCFCSAVSVFFFSF